MLRKTIMDLGKLDVNVYLDISEALVNSERSKEHIAYFNKESIRPNVVKVSYSLRRMLYDIIDLIDSPPVEIDGLEWYVIGSNSNILVPVVKGGVLDESVFKNLNTAGTNGSPIKLTKMLLIKIKTLLDSDNSVTVTSPELSEPLKIIASILMSCRSEIRDVYRLTIFSRCIQSKNEMWLEIDINNTPRPLKYQF